MTNGLELSSPVQEGKRKLFLPYSDGVLSEARDYGNSKVLPVLDRIDSLSGFNSARKHRRLSVPVRECPESSARYLSRTSWSSPRPRSNSTMHILGAEKSPYELMQRLEARQSAEISHDISKEAPEQIPAHACVDTPENIVHLSSQDIPPSPRCITDSPIKRNMEMSVRPPNDLKTLLVSNNYGILEELDNFGASSHVHRTKTPRIKINHMGSLLNEDCHAKAGYDTKYASVDVYSSSVDHLDSVSESMHSDVDKTTEEKNLPGDVIVSELLDRVKGIEEDSQFVLAKFSNFRNSLRLMSNILSSEDSLLLYHMRDTSAQITELKKYNADISATVDQLKEALNEAKKNLAEKNMYVLKFEQETANLKLLTQRSNDELHTFKVKFEHASQEIDVLTNLKSSLISQNEAKDVEICALKTEIEEKDSLNRTLDQKFSKLMEDTRHLHHEMELIEREHNALKYEITEKSQAIDALELLRGELEHKCLCHQEEAESNKSSALKFENESKRLDSILMEANAQLHDLKSQSKEKDSIISGDTQKLAELNAQVNAQKKMISDLKAEVLRTSTGHEHSEAELIHEVETLKAQIFAAQQKSDERIQEIAEQLYHQYSKKHEVKVGQLRKNYEFKIKEMKEVSEESEKRIENLESQLQIEVKEKDYLLSVLEKVKENA